MKRTFEILSTELALLRKKAAAHDDYLAALRLIQKRQALIAFHDIAARTDRRYVAGYTAAITDLEQAIVDITLGYFQEAEVHSPVGTPDLFDRDVPELSVSRG